ncbi:hypothetical protein J5N97_007304 [Dioscorea zingiberensis]|uniref:Fungal lipase-type domain-containing protein n=1 Tax=Dioscorea zingiberensis TaxID=325984 RepID=A0A9D5DBI6_9LILI|nr:hypothetical protein J5N97_007304 [Dioscorea zingiberensis]
MEALRSRLESWIRDQTDRILAARLPPPPRWRWPPWRGRDDRRERERMLREEYDRQRKQLLDLCRAVKADSVADLQEILCCMVLSECVYKKPASEMIRAINKFKSDFGGQIVSLERVQPSLDHVPHRYLLAEAGDTLYASFIGTKQYKDVITDVNILQGAIFHEDDAEDFGLLDVVKEDQVGMQNKMEEIRGKPHQTRTKKLKNNLKPAAHRGFLARAKGIPALELYKLAEKKNQKLVLCGHSLGGAVAVLATLAILRVLLPPLVKDHGKVNIKCITFSQPPVGNAALRDYVHRKGWQHHFKTYCIPEDLVPRILSPAYFHHYNAATVEASPNIENSPMSSAKHDEGIKKSSTSTKENGEQLVLGLGPVQTSFWRLSKLVPLEGIQKHLNLFIKVGKDVRKPSVGNNSVESMVVDTDGEPQSLEIQEGSEGISLAPLPDVGRGPGEASSSQEDERSRDKVGREWRKVPYLPSYVPFGQLYLLGNSSVELLSEAEYSKLTSVRSVIAELRERCQSHSMRSYRSRFQKIFDMCMCLGPLGSSPFLGIEQLPQFPNLQQLLGLAAVGRVVDLGNIVEPPVIQTATSIVPLGWTGIPGNKHADPLKVDIIGHGLHLCTLVQAQVNGNWCSTAVESLPSMPPYSTQHHMQPDLQKMRILIGTPLKKPPKHSVFEDPLPSVLSSPVTDCVNFNLEQKTTSFSEEKRANSEGFSGFVVYCTSDFVTVSKEVYVRTRQVRLLGFEGAGKTSLLCALIEQGKPRNNGNHESMHPELNTQEVVADGICYFDSPGVNLQELNTGASSFREELQAGAHDISRKTDLIVLVHNLSQRIPCYHQSNTPNPQPALSVLLNEARCLGIPWVLAITNKFSVSAHQQKMLVDSAMEAYQAPPSMTEIVNSSPFVIPSAPLPWSSADKDLSEKTPAQKIILAPINFARMPFQRKTIIMPVEGVAALRQLIHHVLRNQEETAFQELADNRLSLELARRRESAVVTKQDSPEKGNSITAAAVGATLGAGLGIVMAIVMGAASALRKP